MAEKREESELAFLSKVIDSSEEIDIHGICVTSDNLVVCDVNNKRVLRYDLGGDFQKSCHIDLFPRDICKVPLMDHVAVTLQESRFSSKAGFIAIIDITSMEMVRKGQCDCTPFGISCTKEGFLVGSWNKIECYDFNFCLSKIIPLPIDNIAVKSIACLSDTKFLYCTSTLNCVSTEGKVSFRLSVDNGKPTGVCVLGENIFISTNTGHILKLDNKCVQMRTLLDCYECHGRLNYICCSKDTSKLYAATDDGSSLSVFQLNRC